MNTKRLLFYFIYVFFLFLQNSPKKTADLPFLASGQPGKKYPKLHAYCLGKKKKKVDTVAYLFILTELVTSVQGKKKNE